MGSIWDGYIPKLTAPAAASSPGETAQPDPIAHGEPVDRDRRAVVGRHAAEVDAEVQEFRSQVQEIAFGGMDSLDHGDGHVLIGARQLEGDQHAATLPNRPENATGVTIRGS